MITIETNIYDGISSKPELDEALMHYGVLGMKWGVRKDPEKAWAKANAKLDKLKKKSGIKIKKAIARASRKAAKANKKASRKLFVSKEKRLDRLTKAAKAQAKLDKLVRKGASADKRLAKWERAMNKAFADTKYGNGVVKKKKKSNKGA